MPRAAIRKLLDVAGIAADRRPQELTLDEWRTLVETHANIVRGQDA
jgi:hypothetical protein